MAAIRFLLVLSLATSTGCGGQASKDVAAPASQMKHENAPNAPPDTQEKSQPRKIIYTAKLELVVDDLDKADEQVNQLLRDQGGYLAKSEMRGSYGSPRSGSWTVRVPVERFNAFMESAGKLGELRGSSIDSDDITDRYYDLKAHLKNSQVEEEGLQKLLLEKSGGGKLEDILAIRRELRTIRGEIDKQQGQLQRWDKETAMATITLNIHSRKDYVPPDSPGLWASIGRTFEDSLDALASFGRWLLLVVVAVLPWLPLLALVIVPLWLRIRRSRAKAMVK